MQLVFADLIDHGIEEGDKLPKLLLGMRHE